MNKKIEGGDGAPEAVDVSADRTQQGEPVAVKKINMAQAGVGERARGYCAGWNDCVDELSRAAKAAAPADAPDDLTAVIEMAAIWIENIKPEELDLWRSTKAGELRRALRSIKSGAAPVPDTGIPTAGEVELRAALKPFAGAYAPEAERVARFYTPDDLAKYGDAFDRNTVTPAVTMGDFRRAYEAFRAPISTTPTSGEVEKAGWKWVPIEPTDEMREACRVLNYCDDIDAEWARMLAAAPSHPSGAKAGNDA